MCTLITMQDKPSWVHIYIVCLSPCKLWKDEEAAWAQGYPGVMSEWGPPILGTLDPHIFL